MVFVTLICACQRTPLLIETERVSDKEVWVQQFKGEGDSVVAVGADLDGKGVVLIGDAATNQWSMPGPQIRSTVYDLCKVEDTWYLGLDSVELVASDSLQNHRRLYWPESLWINDLNKHPIRQMQFSQAQFIVVAGGELAFGSIHHWDRIQDRWSVEEFDHELRSLHIDVGPSGWRALAGGDGILLSKQEGEGQWSRMPIKDWFVIGAWWEGTSLHVLTHRGDQWRSEDQGDTWQRVHASPGKQLVLKSVEFGGTAGRAMLGSDGKMAVQVNGTWRWIQLDTQSDIRAAWRTEDWMLVAVGSEIRRFSLAALRT